jgi:transcriptional regulator with XRE-family HTH domain
MNEKEISKKIGKVLSTRRYNLGITQSDVAEELEVATQQVQKYEKGVDRIPFPKLVYLFKSLDIKFASLDAEFADVQLPCELTIQQESKDNVECN